MATLGEHTPDEGRTIIEFDNRIRAVLVVAIPMEAHGPDHLANCFVEAARVIRAGRLMVRGVHLSDVPEGLVLFCDRDAALAGTEAR